MISIIVPAYNSSGSIVPLIESVRQSLFSGWELIIVDDCSRDRTAAMIEPELDERIRLIKLETNSGPAWARNEGARQARYPVLFFIDSDVVLLPDTLGRIAAAYQAKPDMMAMVGICHREPLNPGYFPSYRCLLEFSWFLDQHGKTSTFFTPRVGTVRREAFFAAGQFDERYRGADVEDYEFGYRLTSRHPVYIDTTVQVKHCFPGFWQNVRNYYKRTSMWTRLFLARRRFDNTGTSAGAGLETMLQLLLPVPVLAAFLHPAGGIVLLLILLMMLYCMRPFLTLCFRERGVLFTLAAFWTRWILAFVVGAGLAAGMWNYWLGLPKIERARLLLKSILNRQLPSYLIFFVTSRCNARCRMCFNWQEMDRAEAGANLNLAEIESIAKQFHTLYHLTVSGGEPFLRDDLPEIIRLFYRHSGTRSVTLTTNGLLTGRIVSAVRQVLEECPHLMVKVPLSIDGVGEVHDRIRGVPGLFGRLVETCRGLEALRRSRPNLIINATTVFSKYNLDETEETIKYVADHWRVNHHAVLLARGNTREADARDVSLERYRQLFATLDAANRIRHRRKYWFSRWLNLEGRLEKYLVYETLVRQRQVIPCLAGRRMMILGAEGALEPCELLRSFNDSGLPSGSIFGNVRERDFEAARLRERPAVKEILRFIKKGRCYCSFECAMAVNILFNPFSFLWLWRLRWRRRAGKALAAGHQPPESG